MWKKINEWFNEVKDVFSPKFSSLANGKNVTIGAQEYELMEMKSSDIKELVALEKKVYLGEAPWPRSAFLMEMNSFFPHLYLVLRNKDTIVAFIGCRVSQGDAHITNLAVDPDFQRRGLANFLLNQAKDFALSHHSKAMTLEVRVSNQDAKRLYRKFGFVAFNIKEAYYTENKEDAVEMKYDLSDSKNK